MRDYVLVPTDDDSAYRIICRMDGGGISDVRTGYLVQTTCEDGGRRMISDVTELSDADMTQSELFRLYYSTGLALPACPTRSATSAVCRAPIPDRRAGCLLLLRQSGRRLETG